MLVLEQRGECKTGELCLVLPPAQAALQPGASNERQENWPGLCGIWWLRYLRLKLLYSSSMSVGNPYSEGDIGGGCHSEPNNSQPFNVVEERWSGCTSVTLSRARLV